MDNRLINDLDDKELDSLMAYSIPYTTENKLNIKKKLAQKHDKLMEEKMITHKRTKFTVFVVAAALFCLTSITVFAAAQGAFYGLFRNLGDVAGYVQSPHERVTSSGITMELSSYLSDDSGIAMEVVFTRDDGLPFAEDALWVGCLDELSFLYSGDAPWYFGEVPDDVIWTRRSPQVTINDRMMRTGRLDNISDNDEIYRGIIVAHDNFDGDNSLEIGFSKMVYNIESRRETVYLDLYGLYQNAQVMDITLGNCCCYTYALRDLFDDAYYTPILTESGIDISSIIFVRAALPSYIDRGAHQWPEGGEGMDIAGLLFYNYIVGIRHTARIAGNGVGYHIDAVRLSNSRDPFSSVTIDSETGMGYTFFRVSCFDELLNYGLSSFGHLQDMGGIDFTVFSYRYVMGDWYIQAQFSANRESSHVVLDMAIDTVHPDIVLFLMYADISLFTTTITLVVQDRYGNINPDVHLDDMTHYAHGFMVSDAFSLRHKNGVEIPLWFSIGAMCCCGIRVYTSGMQTMDYEYFTLMNTSQLEAFVVDGVAFLV